MASLTERRMKQTNMSIPLQRRYHVPPLISTMKESKKKMKDTTKERKKVKNCMDQSKEPNKLQTEQWTNGTMDDCNSKGKTKGRKNGKSKNHKAAGDIALDSVEEKKPGLTHFSPDSLRWEGALEDPVAEAQRLEVYRANRRQRYIESRQAFLLNFQASVSPSITKLNSKNKAKVLT
ncbi:hypothetical protein DNTS_033255 [Danionella cerebrum]|uniref:Uncharacterized protein n=1 Tax=Danionella cerebrum TaxID=2873325 RepID=A0A553RL40_9TELE|nr:hypothetical protein DNTS_033255 [Danionella translucida]